MENPGKNPHASAEAAAATGRRAFDLTNRTSLAGVRASTGDFAGCATCGAAGSGGGGGS